MTKRRLLYINISLILLGVIIAGLWIYHTGGGEYLDSLLRISYGYLSLLCTITVLCILTRFIRWRFLLRNVNIRVPARQSLVIFLASLVGIATPVYIGEVIRSLFMRRKFGIPIRTTTLILVVERLFDIIALAMIGIFTSQTGRMRLVMALFILVAGLLGVAIVSISKIVGFPHGTAAQLCKVRILLIGFGISLLAWVPAALMVSLAAVSYKTWVAPIIGMRIFSTATLLGGMTLMPAGVGSTGTIAILQLQHLGLPLSQSVVIVSIIRLASTGMSIMVGVVFLLFELKVLQQVKVSDSVTHFDRISQEYKKQFSDHIWDYLLDKKINLITKALPDPTSSTSFGLDIGCGIGLQCLELIKRGYSVVGIDSASKLVQKAQIAGVKAFTGNAQALPFGDACFDFVYAVGVLHHLPDINSQEKVCREVARVLRPNGRFIIQETNPRNPLFRFYMGYVFPILKSIDVGTERWIDPYYWENVNGMKLVSLQYFTFLPDFIPQWLMRPFLALERRLEASSLYSYSVHYMAVLQKELI